MKTSRGIYNNIFESTYYYNFGDFTLYFSSEFLLNKFKNKVCEYINNESYILKLRYNIELSCQNFLILAFYKKVEKRGFRVEDRFTHKQIEEKSVYKITKEVI